MKKLLLSLAFLSSLAIADDQYNYNEQQPVTDEAAVVDTLSQLNGLDAITNDILPNGIYAGTFTTFSGAVVNGRGNSDNNTLDLDLGALPELCNYTGKLKINLGLSGNNCWSNSANLHLNEGSCLFKRDIPIEFTSCVWNNNHLTGKYKVSPFPIMTGSFDFAKQ